MKGVEEYLKKMHFTQQWLEVKRREPDNLHSGRGEGGGGVPRGAWQFAQQGLFQAAGEQPLCLLPPTGH